MSIIHSIVGSLILFFNWLFTPKGIKRDQQDQAKIDAATSGLVLYQYKACPFCVKVRREMKRQSMSIETRDAKRSDDAREELVSGGGTLKVPCLRIEEEGGKIRWMYESSDIIEYLGKLCRA